MWPVESRPRSWLCIRWMFSLAAISFPFSMPALERSEPEDWGCIFVAEAYFSNMTDGRPWSVVLGVSSTIPLKWPGRMCVCVAPGIPSTNYTSFTMNDPWSQKTNCITVHTIAHRVVHVIPVHSELSGNLVEAQSHKRHMCDALISAWWWPFLDRSLEEAKIHLQTQKRDTQVKHS